MRIVLFIMLFSVIAAHFIFKQFFTAEVIAFIWQIIFYLFLLFVTAVNLSQAWTFNKKYLGPFQLSFWMIATGFIMWISLFSTGSLSILFKGYIYTTLSSGFITLILSIFRYNYIKRGNK